MRVRVVLAAFAALAALAVGGIVLLAHKIGSSLPLPVLTESCTVTSGGEVSLEPEQMANAATIAAVGITRRVPARAVVIALATAAQESKWRNLSGGDRDSIGLFQQRPSQGWGRPDQIADPRYASGRFYSALLKVKGWQKMPLATAAQRVQHSAYGSAYERWESTAQILASALLGDTGGAVACTLAGNPSLRGQAAVQALTHGLALDWGRARAGVTGTSGPAGVELTASGERSGWQYAHWLVAHAAEQGIKSVTFGDQRWTAKAGTWSRAPSAGATAGAHGAAGGRVVAEVYTAR
jgi:hypothetical protein